jgi:hypothetical protein
MPAPYIPQQQIPVCAVLNTAEEYIAWAEDVLSHEMIVAEYVREIEKYQCCVIRELQQIYNYCQKIMVGLGF